MISIITKFFGQFSWTQHIADQVAMQEEEFQLRMRQIMEGQA